MEDFDDLLEEYPEALASAIESRDRWRQQMAAESADLEFLVSDLDRWPVGSEVTVAFSGGNQELYETIERALRPIDEGCSLTLSLRHPDGSFRSWSTEDTEHAGHIRVGFDMRGYWSLVGTASVDRDLAPERSAIGGAPHQRSMNLGGFHQRLSGKWLRTVRHEFLHALGFKHEHQNLLGPCQDEFRWEDDEGYEATQDEHGRYLTDDAGRRPGIYTYLAGAPNRWGRAKVDHNLRASKAANATSGPFDQASVMLYRFDPLFYKSVPNPCAPPGEGEELSAGDLRGLQLLYPELDAEQRERARRAADALDRAAAAAESNDHEGFEMYSVSYDKGIRAILERIIGGGSQ